LTYSYDRGKPPVLRDVSLNIASGESVAIVGPSGAGKSSLLYCLAGVLTPDSGEVRVDDAPFSALPAADRAGFRLRNMGFVFQFAELMDELTVRENVSLPLDLLGVRRSESARRVDDILARLGIADVAGRRPRFISGGQAQRCAVARALVHRPHAVLADEPTGALDSASGRSTLQALQSLAAEQKTTLVIVTHSAEIADCLDRRVTIVDGQCLERGQ